MVYIDNGNLYPYKGNVLALIAIFRNAAIDFFGNFTKCFS